MVYSDVVKNGWILPYKKKYTYADFKKLLKQHDGLTARFIIVCSAVHWYYKKLPCDYSRRFDDVTKFYFI